MESWKQVKGYEGKYSVSDLGNVISHKKRGIVKDKILKLYKLKIGYAVVNLYDGKANADLRYIHRLVAEHFIDNTENEKCINHLDGDKLNNKTENLEWCSYSRNKQHAYDIGLVKPYDRRGERNPSAKLSVNQVVIIRLMYDQNVMSQRRIALLFKVSQKTIFDIIHNESWQEV